MLPENRVFWVRGEDGEDYGPVELEELRDWVRENRAGIGTDVRSDEPGATWRPWQNYPELVALLAEVQATSPRSGLPGLIIAPIGRRMLACVLDVVLSFFLMVPIVTLLAMVFLPDWCAQYKAALLHAQYDYTAVPPPPPEGQIIGSVIFVVVMTLYMAGFHAAHGQTPAKALFRIKVVDQKGEKPSLTKALLRGLVFTVFLNILFGLPLTYAFFNPERRALHDFIAGTYVVEA